MFKKLITSLKYENGAKLDCNVFASVQYLWPCHCMLLNAFHDASFTLDFQKLKHTESDKLQVQIQAYLDNVFDVGALLEDAETKNAALERVEELEENISHVSAKLK